MSTESDNLQESRHNRPSGKGIWLRGARLLSILLASITGTASPEDGKSATDITDEPAIVAPHEEESPQLLSVDSRIEIVLPDTDVTQLTSFNSEMYALDSRRKVVYKISSTTGEAIIVYAMPWMEHPTLLATLNGCLTVVDSTSNGQRLCDISKEVLLVPEAHWVRFDAPNQEENI